MMPAVMVELGRQSVTLRYTVAPRGRSVVTATPAFVRTRCLDCGALLEPGQRLLSTAEGFRHTTHEPTREG